MPKSQIHRNARGSHTTVVERSVLVLDFLKKNKIEFSPGKISVIDAKSSTIKFIKINNAVSEMTLTSGKSKQIFKVFESADFLQKLFSENKEFSGWNIKIRN